MAHTPTDGGPAFPQSVSGHDGPTASYDFVDGGGMSLRDYFAAKALVGLLAAGPEVQAKTASEFAGFSYELADFMLRERAK